MIQQNSKTSVARQAELAADLEPRGAGERRERRRHAADEEHRVAVLEAERAAQRLGPLGAEVARDRARAALSPSRKKM